MRERAAAESIVKRHVIASCAVGLLPSPFFSIKQLNLIQLDLLKDLSCHYRVDYTAAQARAWLVGLNGSFAAKLGAVTMAIAPVVNEVVGGVSRSALCGASTHALGQIAITHFEANGDLDDLDLALAKEAYERGISRGKEVVNEVTTAKPQAREVLDKLERLTRLHARGVIGDEDYEAMRRALLDRT